MNQKAASISHSLVLNEFEKWGSAILERHIAKPFGSEGWDDAKQ